MKTRAEVVPTPCIRVFCVRFGEGYIARGGKIQFNKETADRIAREVNDGKG